MKKYMLKRENLLLFSVLLYIIIKTLWGNDISDPACKDMYTQDKGLTVYDILFYTGFILAYLSYPFVWIGASTFRLLQIMHIGFSVILVALITANSLTGCENLEAFADAQTTMNTCKLLFAILQLAWIILSAGMFITQKRKAQ